LIWLLDDVDQSLAEAERIAADLDDRAIQQRATAQLVELRASLERVETLLRKSPE
jgi:hypothetical protein